MRERGRGWCDNCEALTRQIIEGEGEYRCMDCNEHPERSGTTHPDK